MPVQINTIAMNIIVIYTQKVRGSSPLLPTSPKEAVLGTSITNIPITNNTTTATSNLLLNSGFENGSGDQPTGWTATQWNVGGIFTWDNKVAYSGQYSLKLEATDPNDLR